MGRSTKVGLNFGTTPPGDLDLSPCCRHPQLAHDEHGCLLNGCGCLGKRTGELHERKLIGFYEVTKMFRVHAEDLRAWVEAGEIRMDRDSRNVPCIPSDQLERIKQRQERMERE